jgi:F-type H+-transporting ATPase subunit a
MKFELLSPISPNVISTLVIVLVLSVVFIIVGVRIRKLDPARTPKGFIFVCVTLVDNFNNFVSDYISGKRFKFFAPYFFTVIIFLALANTISLFGMSPPLANLSVALALTIITFVAIKIAEVKFLGMKNKLKSLVGGPVWWLFPILLPTNLISEVSTPFSMGLRLFVNLFSGLIMSTMVFGALAGIESILGSFMASVFAGVFFHGVFDIFFGLIQAFVFFMLTIINISMASEA